MPSLRTLSTIQESLSSGCTFACASTVRCIFGLQLMLRIINLKHQIMITCHISNYRIYISIYGVYKIHIFTVLCNNIYIIILIWLYQA